MPYITPETIRKAKQIDLLTYLQNTEPNELVQLSGDTFCTREHDSLKISNGKWHWFSRGIGGSSALDYLIKVQNFSFLGAVETILGRAAVLPPVSTTPKKPEKHLLMPELNDNADTVIRYLTGRGIEREIIQDCLSRHLLLETKEYHDALFVGYDRLGEPRYAAVRATQGDYKGDVSGSDKHYSFRLADRPDAQCVHVFESAIDAMSYATLLKKSGRDWRQIPLLSLAGVFLPKRENVIPVALQQFLSEHPTHTLFLHLDNDDVGRGAAQGILGGLKDRYQVIDSPPKNAKDVNEYLVQQQRRQKQKEAWER